jgi:GNAT superfamily N-acetyltransferase
MNDFTFTFSNGYADVAAIHDALYSYNLSKTGHARQDIHAEHLPEQYAFVVRSADGTFHGGIAFHWEQPEHTSLFVDFFYLDETLRGSGFGKKLFETLVLWAKEHDAVEINLTTNTFQAPGFYRKLGFTVTSSEAAPAPLCPENIHYHLNKKI